jgi:hypothetical protein
VKITISIGRAVIIHDDVDPFHVDPPTEDISSDKDTLLKCFERGVALDTINQEINIGS